MARTCGVRDLDGWRCRLCGKSGRLEVDHVVPLHLNPHKIPTTWPVCKPFAGGVTSLKLPEKINVTIPHA